MIGAYNNKKTAANETTSVYVDDLLLRVVGEINQVPSSRARCADYPQLERQRH